MNNPITKKIIISRDVIFYEEHVWDWNDAGQQQILVNFDGEETKKGTDQSNQQQQLPNKVLSNPSTSGSNEGHPQNAFSPQVQRQRKNPARIIDYVSGDELSDDDTIA